MSAVQEPQSADAEPKAAAPTDAEPAASAKPGSWKARLEDHLREYGGIAVLVYLTIWLVVWAGFAVGIAAGFSVDVAADGETAGLLGVIGAAWLPTKLTQPLRIGATFIVTPIVAGIWHRIRGKKPT